MEPIALCCLLKAVCTTLRFPARASTAAHTYLRHYLKHKHFIQPQQRPSDQALLSACVLLASKVEEVPVSNNHLLNVTAVLHDLLVKQHMSIRFLLGGPEKCEPAVRLPAGHAQPAAPPAPSQDGPSNAAPAQGSGLAPHSATGPGYQQQGMAGQPDQLAAGIRGQATVTAPALGAAAQVQPVSDAAGLKAAVGHCSVLVGDTYQHQKTLVLEAEQQLLRLLQWQLPVCHPTAALLHAAAALRVPSTLLAVALFLLNDAIVFTDILLPNPHPGPPGAPSRSHNTAQATIAAGAAAQPGGNGALMHMSDTGLYDSRRELVVALACLLVTADMAAEQDVMACRACQHAFACQARRHDSDGASSSALPQGTSSSAIWKGQPRCRHWLRVLGVVDAGAVEVYANYILTCVHKARIARVAWDRMQHMPEHHHK